MPARIRNHRNHRRLPRNPRRRPGPARFVSDAMRDHYTGGPPWPWRTSAPCDNARRWNDTMRSPWLVDLQQRGLVADVTKPEELDAHLTAAPRTVYVGFDPTAH